MGHNKKNDTMDIKEFVSNFKTHPILFIGSGLSRRYLKNSPDWHELLSNIAKDIWGNDLKYIELAEKFRFDPLKIAGEYETLFNAEMRTKPKFLQIKEINDQNIRNKILISPFKIYLSKIFSNIEYKEEITDEIEMFQSLENYIKSIVTTNYDGMLEDLIKFNKLVGNDILLSNQYGTIYKIHGCHTEPQKIVFTQDDYNNYKEQNKLIISQLISLFIHSPVIFLGYGNDDENVNLVLETIYSFVGNNQVLRDKLKNNFLVVEYAQNSTNRQVSNFDKTLESGVHLSFNKIATDDYISIYKSIIDQPYAIESGLLRLVDDLMQRTFVDSKNKDKAQVIHYIIEDIKRMKPDIAVLGAIDNKGPKSIVYKDKKVNIAQDHFIINYFRILDNKEIEEIKLINTLKPKISKKHYFPIFGFSNLIGKTEETKLSNVNDLKDIQEKILDSYVSKCNSHFGNYSSIEEIIDDTEVSKSSKHPCICSNIWKDNINIGLFESYLRNYKGDKTNSEFRRLITLFDYKKYSISLIETDEEDDEDL